MLDRRIRVQLRDPSQPGNILLDMVVWATLADRGARFDELADGTSTIYEREYTIRHRFEFLRPVGNVQPAPRPDISIFDPEGMEWLVNDLVQSDDRNRWLTLVCSRSERERIDPDLANPPEVIV